MLTEYQRALKSVRRTIVKYELLVCKERKKCATPMNKKLRAYYYKLHMWQSVEWELKYMCKYLERRGID